MEQKRNNSSGSDGDGKNMEGGRLKGATEDQMPHVTQEAVETSKIMDKDATSPELEQGTPISEVCFPPVSVF